LPASISRVIKKEKRSCKLRKSCLIILLVEGNAGLAQQGGDIGAVLGEDEVELLVGLVPVLPIAELFGHSRTKIRPTRKKIWSPSKFQFLKEFGLKKNTFSVCVSGKISFFPLELEKIREGNQFFLKFSPFSAFLFTIGQNSAADLSGRAPLFIRPPFDICGRTIGQLAMATLPGPSCRPRGGRSRRGPAGGSARTSGSCPPWCTAG
jgi:hypothetical protein